MARRMARGTLVLCGALWQALIKVKEAYCDVAVCEMLRCSGLVSSVLYGVWWGECGSVPV